ncbi:MAG: succinate--CoA ligase [Rhodospirillaceae bacterium]|nr:succinate--CoA ligase [Rhodospirillaceae bacterium]MBT5512614.1 succinate--CoA ligase [Rhodospirillaceae bacterium]MBT6606928.1 succinate--CoA ligase [Rhodospirillaceae bacterium]MBT7512088.1 succinate--CoA ligase [Rhodospirillaceae bacterium]
MNFEEYAAKPILAAAGINVPKGILAHDPDAAADAVATLGPVVVKAQVPTGKRGKAGGIQLAQTADEARTHAANILGMTIATHVVEKVWVEELSDIAREFYAAVLNDPTTKSPVVMFSTEGGMDIEEIAVDTPEKLRKAPVDIRKGFDIAAARALVDGEALDGANEAIAETLVKLYEAYRANDAELLEINPLVLTGAGGVIALDCKFSLDDSGIKRQQEIAPNGTPDKLTELETRGEDLGIKYIELEGDVAVLANGAGLTMTTMDVVRHHGGNPANFCEIGGEAYTKATDGVKMVLDKPGVKSLVVNFCGAFARCDVMMEGFLTAWEELKPEIPVFFSIAGTGDLVAIKMLKDRMGVDPLPDMDAACKAAVDAAKGGAS